MSRAGLEPVGTQNQSQIIDSINRQNRSNRSFRRFEVHGRYSGYEFFSRDQGENDRSFVSRETALGLFRQDERRRSATWPECFNGCPPRRLRPGLVSRFGCFVRSGKQLVLALEEFRSLGIDFISHQEALDTSTPVGPAMFTIIAANGRIGMRRNQRAPLRASNKLGGTVGNRESPLAARE